MKLCDGKSGLGYDCYDKGNYFFILKYNANKID